MPKTYRVSTGQRVANAVLGTLLRAGAGPSFMRLLTVTGRTTGKPRTTPVVPVETDEGHWLVAPFGEVGWVRNVRASGTATLRRGRDVRTYTATELDPDAAVPVLRRYLAQKPVGRYVGEYFDVTPDASDEAFAAEAPRHPVFALRPA